jgi:hypothetical protein
MDKDVKCEPIPAPLGNIEPHAPLLNIPPEGQSLFKIVTIENLLSAFQSS